MYLRTVQLCLCSGPSRGRRDRQHMRRRRGGAVLRRRDMRRVRSLHQSACAVTAAAARGCGQCVVKLTAPRAASVSVVNMVLLSSSLPFPPPAPCLCLLVRTATAITAAAAAVVATTVVGVLTVVGPRGKFVDITHAVRHAAVRHAAVRRRSVVLSLHQLGRHPTHRGRANPRGGERPRYHALGVGELLLHVGVEIEGGRVGVVGGGQKGNGLAPVGLRQLLLRGRAAPARPALALEVAPTRRGPRSPGGS